MKAEDFIKDNTISDRQAIKNALCVPALPDEWELKPLTPIGVGRFIGEKMPSEWSCNIQLECGQAYPIYSYEGRFVIGKNGKGLKFNPKSWRELLWF